MPEYLKQKDEFINVLLCPLVFLLIAVTITAFKPEGPAFFRYEQLAVQNGEWWRLLSAHFTHSTWNHLFLNMLGLMILTHLFSEVATWRRWLILMIVGSLFCSAAFFYLHGNHYSYVGMSDVLHGVIVAYAILDYRNFRSGSLILILGTWAKVIWEQSPWYVEASGDFIGGRVATESHLYGTIIGSLLGLTFLAWNWQQTRKDRQPV